jgi:hypothetical protein
MLPAYFSVERGSTVGDLIEREGERSYYDPATERTYTLREIYHAAGVPASTRIDSAVAALAPLEGRTLGAVGAPASPGGSPVTEATVTGRAPAGEPDRPPHAGEAERAGNAAPSARTVRDAAIARTRIRLRDTIDSSVLNELREDQEVATLPATAIVGVSATSAIGRRLEGMTVGDVGAMTREEFIDHATHAVAPRRRRQAERQAEEIWRKAQDATSAYAPEPEEDADDVGDPDA